MMMDEADVAVAVAVALAASAADSEKASQVRQRTPAEFKLWLSAA